MIRSIVPGITAAYRLKNTEDLTARIGYAFSPAILGYVKGGAAWVNASAASVAPGAVPGETASFTRAGYTVGGWSRMEVCARLVPVRRIQLSGFRNQEQQSLFDGSSRSVIGIRRHRCVVRYRFAEVSQPASSCRRQLQV